MPYPDLVPLLEEVRKDFHSRMLPMLAEQFRTMQIGPPMTSKPATPEQRLRIFMAELANGRLFADRYGAILDEYRKEGLEGTESSNRAWDDLQSYKTKMTALLRRAQEQEPQAAPIGSIVSQHEGARDVAVPQYMPIIEPEPVLITFIGLGKDGESVMEYATATERKYRLAHLDGTVGKDYTRHTLEMRDGRTVREGDVIPSGDVIAYASSSSKALHMEEVE